MKKNILIIVGVIAVLLLAAKVKVSINHADAQVRLDPPQEVYVRSENNVVWKITVDAAGILGTDSVGVYQP